MNPNLKRIYQWQNKKNALETLPVEYPRELFTGEKYQSWQLKVGAKKPESKLKSLILSFIP